MNITCRAFLTAIACSLLLACGGSKSPSSANPSSLSSSSSSSSASSSSSSSSSASSSSTSSSSGLAVVPDPDWFPKGQASSLPQLSITTTNQTPITSREIYIPGQYELREGTEILASGNLDIRGRGNSTWDWPKKPYRLQLEKSVELLGMPASKHWILLANYADKTLIRNDVGFTLSRALGFDYTVRDRHVEVTLNGQYQGIYQLVEQIRLAKTRLNIPELKVTDVDESSVTGSYLLEVDFRMAQKPCEDKEAIFLPPYCVNGVNIERQKTFCLDSKHGMEPFCLKDPDDLLTMEREVQRNYISQYFTATEEALFGSDFADPTKGYAAYLDVESAVNYYLFNEFIKNIDGATGSFYLFKKRNGKLFFGPVWDLDLAMGGTGLEPVIDPRGWHVRSASWFARLFEDPAFAAKVKTRWNQLKTDGVFEQTFRYIQARADWLSIKQEDNFRKWDIFNECTWANRLILGSYDAEVEELLRWQRARYEWMDGVINGTLDPEFTPITTRCIPKF